MGKTCGKKSLLLLLCLLQLSVTEGREGCDPSGVGSEKRYRETNWFSVRFEQKDGKWELCYDTDKTHFVLSVAVNPPQKAALEAIHCKIGHYLLEMCTYHGCQYLFHLEEPSSSVNPLWVEIHNTTLYGKKLITDDVHRLLEGQEMVVHEGYLLQRWSFLLTQPPYHFQDEHYEVALIHKQDYGVRTFSRTKDGSASITFDSLHRLLKQITKDGYHTIFENTHYMILLKPVGYRYRFFTQEEILREIQDKSRDLHALFVTAQLDGEAHKEKSPRVDNFSKAIQALLEARKLRQQHSIFSRLLTPTTEEWTPLFELIVQRFKDLEVQLSEQTPTCDWKGGKWIFGDRGCEDDVYLVCHNGVLTGMEQGCDS